MEGPISCHKSQLHVKFSETQNPYVVVNPQGLFEILCALESPTKDLRETSYRINISQENNCNALYKNNC